MENIVNTEHCDTRDPYVFAANDCEKWANGSWCAESSMPALAADVTAPILKLWPA